MDWRTAEATLDYEPVTEPTVSRLFEAAATRHADAVAQRYKGGIYDRSLAAADVVPAAPDGGYADLTFAEMREIVRRLAAGFRAIGAGADDRVGILANTRLEWAQTDFALLAAGTVVTTVYPSSSESQVEYLLSDPGASGVVVENAELLSRVLAVEDALDLDFVVVIDEIPDGSGMAGAARDRDDIYSLAAVYERGTDVFEEAAYESWLDARAPDDPASLIYTSGTTGRPKGVELTHGNFRANVGQCYRRFSDRPESPITGLSPDSTTLSFLPLAHVFERLVGHFLIFAAGATVAYAENPDTLRDDFRTVRPTVGTSVPRVYEKLYDAVRAAARESPVKRRLFEWAVDVGRTYQATDDPGRLLTGKYRLADRLVFSQVREALGGRIELLISGGGSLSPELCRLYHAMGLPILEGYGLTETAPVLAANPPAAPAIGTIGPPLYDVDVRLDSTATTAQMASDDGEVGELLVRGPNVFDGYWNRPEETAAAFTDDGWFRTGDVVEQRPDGYLVFRERAKRLLVLSTGKNVAPGPIEDAVAASPVVESCLVVGDGRKFVAALVVPDVDGLREWAAGEGIDLPDDRTALCRDERVRARVERAVDAANDELESHEQIKRFRLVPEPFSTDDDTLTPTMKKRRDRILDRYDEAVASLYEGAEAPSNQ
ncbi:AMP-dependent synthetase/ligase [Halobellus marinus]|uniref:AMP-dependent synthetase/ligase n=1 Tax=Halobellus TaxID=1073986 RepID=UPI0028AD6D88|nr:long-chain fatty acid--CoA ligase [Halobellus sp. DFY28]